MGAPVRCSTGRLVIPSLPDLLALESSCQDQATPGGSASYRCDLHVADSIVARQSSSLVEHGRQASVITLDAFSSSYEYSTSCSGGDHETVLFWLHRADGLPLGQPTDR